jgi:hypothetical protein
VSPPPSWATSREVGRVPRAAGLDHRAGLHRRQPRALEILGLAANGATYGAATVHVYRIGAVPAMVFLGIVMMPFYYAWARLRPLRAEDLKDADGDRPAGEG